MCQESQGIIMFFRELDSGSRCNEIFQKRKHALMFFKNKALGFVLICHFEQDEVS